MTLYACNIETANIILISTHKVPAHHLSLINKINKLSDGLILWYDRLYKWFLHDRGAYKLHCLREVCAHVNELIRMDTGLIAERGGCSPAAFVRLDDSAIVGHWWKVLFALQLNENFTFFFLAFLLFHPLVVRRRLSPPRYCIKMQRFCTFALARRSIRVCRIG